ncbi:hypothetical protein ACQKKX_09625 [Neorhizobium sp. NPDC001467]
MATATSALRLLDTIGNNILSPSAKVVAAIDGTFGSTQIDQ